MAPSVIPIVTRAPASPRGARRCLASCAASACGPKARPCRAAGAAIPRRGRRLRRSDRPVPRRAHAERGARALGAGRRPETARPHPGGFAEPGTRPARSAGAVRPSDVHPGRARRNGDAGADRERACAARRPAGGAHRSADGRCARARRTARGDRRLRLRRGARHPQASRIRGTGSRSRLQGRSWLRRVAGAWRLVGVRARRLECATTSSRQGRPGGASDSADSGARCAPT